MLWPSCRPRREVRLAPNHALHVSSHYWGEPERAPHRRVEFSQSTYYGDDDDDDVWYVRHPRAAIEIVQQSTIYIPFYLEAA